jgi:hypothetical protein
MNQIQKRLNELYLNYLNTILKDKEIYEGILNYTISSPMFINSEVKVGKYIESDLKVLYVGKENNGWFNKEDRKRSGLDDDIQNAEKYLNELLNLYYDFDIGSNYKSPIFKFFDILVDKARKINPKTGFLYTNLLRIDCSRLERLKEKVFEIDNNNILLKEIEILKPDVIIFATGTYDGFLKSTFKGVEYVTTNNWKPSEYSLLQHLLLPEKSIRIYHPGCYNIKGPNYSRLLSEDIVKHVLNGL